MLKRFLLPVLVLTVLLYSCKKDVTSDTIQTTTNNGTGNTGNTTPAIVYNVDKAKMLQLVNNIRQAGCKCGSTSMPPVAVVAWNDKLGKAAFDHSVDMKANDYFSHTGLNGSTPGQRITAAGYTWKTIGENIAMGYSSEQAVISGWLSSEGHCKNIMNGSFKEMGAGRQDTYWTQVFGVR